MTEQICPCPLANLELGDPRREPILDCTLARKNGHPCYSFPKEPVEKTNKISKTKPLPGIEKHTKSANDIDEDQWPILHAIVLG